LQEAEITTRELVETRKDTPKMLDFADKTLNQMPFAIAPGIILARLDGVFVGRNDDGHAASDEFIHKHLGTIAAVGYHRLKVQINNQVMGLENVMPLSRRQVQPQGIAQPIDRDMDFGAKAAPTASQCLFRLPAVFFVAPAAQAWARTMVLSTILFSISGSSAKCASIRSHTP
jgi:hypothetical protein